MPTAARTPLLLLTLFPLACSSGASDRARPAAPGDPGAAGDPAAVSDPAASVPAAPLAAGAAQVTGRVAGVDLAPLTAAFALEPVPGRRVVVLAEPGAPCRPTGRPHLVLYACRMPSTATMRAGEPDCAAAPDSGAALLEAERDLASADGGTLTITDATAAAVTGELTLRFGGDQVSGRFHAAACPADADRAPAGE
jgi:hypothetical protein